MNTKQYAASSLLVALLITNTSPWIPLAMANPVVPNSSRLGPQMDVASNGISIVNINTPNDKGLSHNQYDSFSINNNGLILNNANRPVSTELAGYIMGNPNLVGPTAKTILNEVTGTNSTAMNGALEVAGNKAHVIIANPNGISINNGTFINTNAATLTTGKPIIDNGNISAYKINQGTIQIDSQGLNTSKTARTDILAEAVKVNGELWAKNLQMVSGQNTVNVNSDGKVINVTKNNDSNKIGLDVVKIGGMYANSIYLVGTNDGLGVNNKGIVSASDTLSLDANGRVENTGTITSSDAYIKSKSFDQTGEAKFYADNATFVVDSLSQNGNQATNKNPIILAQNSLSIAGQAISNTNGSVIKTDGKLQIGRNISYDGVISGKIDNITNIGATIEAGTGGKIFAKEINNINGGVTLKRVQVGEVETIKDEVTVNDYPGEKFRIKDPKIYHLNELTDDIDQVVVEAENLQFYAKKDHKDDWVRYNYTRTKHKDVVDTSKPARIISGGDLVITADHVKNDSSQISSAGEITGKIEKFEQTNPSSKEYIIEDGTAVSYSRHHHHGADSTNIDTAPYHKVTELNTKLPLSVFKSNDLNSKTNIVQDSSLLNSISKISQNPNTSYIMETDPNFTNRRNFLSSDYVLNRLKLDPMNVQKRLGDGYYEQQLVMQEILSQTGKNRLQSGLTAEEQYRKLMDAGINLTKSQSIALGRKLTVAEQNNLKEDVVLLVSNSVVLPNGKTETVLVPTLYLAPKTKRADGGANVQGESINLNVDKLNNSGSIIADNNTNIIGNNIHNNGGLISGNNTIIDATTDVINTTGTIVGESNVLIHANQDFINEGGHIKQNSASGQLSISADRDVINNGKKYISSDNEIVWDDRNKRKEVVTTIDQGIIEGQGNINIKSNRDVVMNAGIVQGKENIDVDAGRNVELSTQDASLNIKEDHYHKGKSGGGHSITTETHVEGNFTNSVGSSIEGKSVKVNANQDVKAKGSDILAKDDVNINADNVKFESAKDVATEQHSLQERKKSIAKRESIDAIDNSHIETVSGSNIGGKTVNIKATNSIDGKSVTILGENNVELQSGGEVNIGADKHILDSNSSYHHKKSGLLGGAGIGFSIGKERINSDDSRHEEVTARSTIASTNGNINIQSNDTLQLTSGNIVSKNSVNLSGSNVILDGNIDNTLASHNESYKKSGLTVSLGGAAINAVTNGTRTIKQAGSRNDKRLAAFELNEARKQFQDGYYAVDGALKGEKIRNSETGKVEKVDGKDKRGAKNIDNAVNLSISIGSTSQHQNQSIDVHEYNGGTIISDGSVNIEANNATKSGVNLVGQDILAKEVNINSASDINLSAGKNTFQAKDNYKHSGWSVGASLSLTSGSLLGFDASGSLAKQNGVTDQVTYKPTSIRAVELAQIKAKRDTEIIGSKISGRGVTVNTGNNLNIESLQSIDNYKEHSKSAGFSVSTSPKFKGTVGSVGGSVGRIDSKLKTVTDQAGIFAGDNGYNISTGNTTSLKGAIISSKANKDINLLTTRNLDIKNIKNEAEYNVRDNGLQYNNFGSSKTKSKKEFDKIYKHIGLTPTGGVGAHKKSSSITKSAISDGKIIENGQMIDMKTINTDIEHSLNELQSIFDKKSIEEKQQLAHLFSINANEAIHQIAKHKGWDDGDPRKVALHGLVGGTTAKLGGGQFSDGVYAAGLSEAMMPQFKKWAGTIEGPDGKKAVNPERLQQMAFVLGYATNNILGSNSYTGAYTAHMGAKYNSDFLPSWVTDAAKSVEDSIDSVVDDTKSKLDNAVTTVNNAITNEVTYAGNQINSAIDTVNDVVSNEATYAENQINNAIDTVSDVVTNEVTYAGNQYNNAVETVSNVVTNEVNYAGSQINSAAENINNVMTNEVNYAETQVNNAVESVNNNIAYVADRYNNMKSSVYRFSEHPISYIGQHFNKMGTITSEDIEFGNSLYYTAKDQEAFNHSKQNITDILNSNNFGDNFAKSMNAKNDKIIVDGFISLGNESSLDKNQQIIEPRLMNSFNNGLKTLGVDYTYNDKLSVYDNANNAILNIRDILEKRSYYGLTQERGQGVGVSINLNGTELNARYHGGDRWTNYGKSDESYQAVEASISGNGEKLGYGYDFKNQKKLEEHPSFENYNKIWRSYDKSNPIADKVPDGFLNSQNPNDKTFTIGWSAYDPRTLIGGSDEYVFNITNIEADLLNVHPFDDKKQRINRYIRDHKLE